MSKPPSQLKGEKKGGDGRIQPGEVRNPSGRPKKSVTWKKAEHALREALPRLLLMPKDKMREILEANPTGAEVLAALYIREHVVEAVNRFLGKTPDVITGEDGLPLIPAAPALDLGKWTPLALEALRKRLAGDA